MNILCINSGSSSLKFALYDFNGKEDLTLHGAAEEIGSQEGRFWIWPEGQNKIEKPQIFPDHKAAIEEVFSLITELNLTQPTAIGHRVVQGGVEYTAPVIINSQVLDKLKSLLPFAPLHLPAEIAGIEAVFEEYPQLPQIACFDTAFHSSIPEIARRFPLPARFWDEGICRFGFHGLSYEYIMSVLGSDSSGRVIIAHLGNGSSMAAVLNGQPQDTTMGFTPAGGLMMGTRSGDLDPGILIYLMREKGYDAWDIDNMVNNESGLLGVSRISSDMQTLLNNCENTSRLAIDMYCYSVRKFIGAMAASLEGLDTLVFTGGIGERACFVRSNVCQRLEFLGIRLDEQQNKSHSRIITTADSACKVMVIPTKEDLMIARHTRRLIQG